MTRRPYSLLASAVVAGLLLSACAETPPAAAPAPVATDSSGGAVADAQPTDRSCQTDDDTGSHLRKRTVCTTPGEDAANRAAMDNAMRYQRSAGFGSSGH